MELGDKIKNLRRRENYTQTELADKLGIAQNTLSDYERNRVQISIETVKQLCEIFDVEQNYFIGDDPVKTEPKKENNSMTFNLLKRLVEEGIIEDPNNIDEDTIKMIINTAKVDLALIKNKK